MAFFRRAACFGHFRCLLVHIRELCAMFYPAGQTLEVQELSSASSSEKRSNKILQTIKLKPQSLSFQLISLEAIYLSLEFLYNRLVVIFSVNYRADVLGFLLGTDFPQNCIEADTMGCNLRIFELARASRVAVTPRARFAHSQITIA